MPHNIIRGQKVNSDLVARAKELRRTMTPAENILWQELRGNRLGGFHFRRQQIISRYIADFYCHAAALVVELDGEIHESQRERDQARDAVIRDYDILVMRVKNQEVEENLQTVLKRIHAECVARTKT
jgi:very-short-patch-repair endonuclease